MSDPFTDLREVMALQHHRLKEQIATCKDKAQIKILERRRWMIWHIWREFLFYRLERDVTPLQPESPPSPTCEKGKTE